MELTVVAKNQVASEVVLIALAAADGSRLPDWTPGAHVDLLLPNGMVRQYSLCGDRWNAHLYQLAVSRKSGGRGGSVYVNDCLKVGDTVVVGGVRNNFNLAPSQRYLFIAGGIGITPIVPMIKQAEMMATDWRLFYTGRSRQSMAFQGELAGCGDRVWVVPRDERNPVSLQSWLGPVDEAAKVYFCGPARLMADVSQLCANWPEHSLRSERFAAAPLPAPARSLPFKVVLASTGVTVTVQPGISVLEAIRRAGLNVLSGCQQGLCGTCDTTVLAGFPDHRDSVLSDHDREAGDCMLICVSRSRSTRLVLDL
jgi:ferredoxin-NADP reductase